MTVPSLRSPTNAQALRAPTSDGVLRAAAKKQPTQVREAFELLLDLLRKIDDDTDGIIFFADEAGSWQVGVDWRDVFPAYFRCLAAAASGDEFAREVNRAVSDFADYERPKHMATARTVASAAQKAALRSLPIREER